MVPGRCHGDEGFDPEYAYSVLDRHAVTLALLTRTMLKLMRQCRLRRGATH